jgi:hypothetical protein
MPSSIQKAKRAAASVNVESYTVVPGCKLDEKDVHLTLYRLLFTVFLERLHTFEEIYGGVGFDAELFKGWSRFAGFVCYIHVCMCVYVCVCVYVCMCVCKVCICGM